MKKQVVCTLAAALAVTSLSAFAANPFVDVPSDSWAYQSVVELADAGIIQGVDGQYFQGHRSITRYEAAEMVAKAMAHMDKASVEQRALINKLADEYADELNSLGVRVTNLENRVGNTRVFGDAFVRYRYQNGNKKDDSSWDTRFRIRAQGQVNDRTKVTAGVSTGFRPFASNKAASDEGNNPYVDLAKVDYNFGSKNWELSVGRNDVYRIGRDAYGLQYFDALDGAELRYHNDKLAITTGYGKFKDGKKPGVDTIHASQAYSNAFSTSGLETGYGEIDAFFGGGKAELKMLDESDVLHTGIDILVTLPQKKRQSLAALSGGERALTVIALLFAFLRYRPSPFSVLDEIDAPLDEANVMRFGRFLQEFAEQTQFIVVTHRKGTMEVADTMYGVTVEESGVSRLLSVRLDELDDDVAGIEKSERSEK